MTTAWEKFQELLKIEMLKVYSEKVVDLSMNPRNLGTIENADGFARLTGPCGDTMEIWLTAKGGSITNASFMTDGCGTSIASGGMVAEMAKGKDIAEALKIGQQDVLGALGGLPEESEHCALLAANTLKAAITDYLDMKKTPWGKTYRK